MHIGGLKGGHNCQIDCTNHDEVINKLEIKSKDLYYFWRNYQWLYQKYYSQKHEEPAQNSHKIQELEDDIHQLQTQNKKLRIENQSMRKKLQNDSTSSIQKQYQKQIQRLNSKCRDYESIREKLSNEINALKAKIRQSEDNTGDNQTRLKRQIKRQEAIIVQLQQNIDQLRNKMLNSNTNNSQLQNIEERHQRQLQKIKVLISSIQQQCNSIIQEEFQNTRYVLLQDFPRVFEQFSRGDLSNIVTVEEIQDN